MSDAQPHTADTTQDKNNKFQEENQISSEDINSTEENLTKSNMNNFQERTFLSKSSYVQWQKEVEIEIPQLMNQQQLNSIENLELQQNELAQIQLHVILPGAQSNEFNYKEITFARPPVTKNLKEHRINLKNDENLCSSFSSAPMNTMSVREFIKANVRHFYENPNENWEFEANCVAPFIVQERVWICEWLKQFTREVIGLIGEVRLECTAMSCPRMSCSSEWHFLCSHHGKTRECCAEDYMLHAIESVHHVLLSPKRISCAIGSVYGEFPNISDKEYQVLFRRLYRVFGHVYYHHPAIFKSFESRTRLCARFTTFARAFRMMIANASGITIPDVSIGIRNEAALEGPLIDENSETNNRTLVLGNEEHGTVGSDEPTHENHDDTVSEADTVVYGGVMTKIDVESNESTDSTAQDRQIFIPN